MFYVSLSLSLWATGLHVLSAGHFVDIVAGYFHIMITLVLFWHDTLAVALFVMAILHYASFRSVSSFTCVICRALYAVRVFIIGISKIRKYTTCSLLD